MTAREVLFAAIGLLIVWVVLVWALAAVVHAHNRRRAVRNSPALLIEITADATRFVEAMNRVGAAAAAIKPKETAK